MNTSVKSITLHNNRHITGKNSMSYNDKHPINPIVMRPIKLARKNLGYSGRYWQYNMLAILSTWSKSRMVTELKRRGFI